MADQVIVDDTLPSEPFVVQLWSGVRQFAPPIMAFVLGRGWIANDVAVVLGFGGAIAWPIVYGQLKARARAKQAIVQKQALIDIASSPRVPDSVAVLVPAQTVPPSV